MTLAIEAEIIEEIARILASIGEREKSNVLMYAEAGRAWVGGSIFIERDGKIVYLENDDDDPLDLVLKLWGATEPNKRWRGMMVTVSGDKFKAEFDYGEGWSQDEDEGDRREPRVRAFFGDKPIQYPPLEGAEPWQEE